MMRPPHKEHTLTATLFGEKAVIRGVTSWCRVRFGLNRWILVGAVAAGFTFSGCATPAYLARLGWGQAGIILHTKSNDAVLDDPAVDPSVKEKIELVLEAKAYGEHEIGLAETSNFLGFYQVEGPCLLYVVSACPKDRLESHRWWFPITGQVTTKGFFRHHDALREKRKLEKKGLDVFIQGAQAYSTLGWFKDPIFSTMLTQDRAALVNVVIHELTHATVFFKDQMDFNEQIACFVGCQGAVDFSGVRFGPGSPDQERAQGIMDDGILFARFMRGVCRRLNDLYARPIPVTLKLEERERIFREIKQELECLRDRFTTDFYLGFEDVRLNNAVVLAMARYVASIEQIQRAYEKLGKDLRKTVAFFRQLEKEGVSNPESYLSTWLEKRNSEEADSLHHDEK